MTTCSKCLYSIFFTILLVSIAIFPVPFSNAFLALSFCVDISYILSTNVVVHFNWRSNVRAFDFICNLAIHNIVYSIFLMQSSFEGNI